MLQYMLKITTTSYRGWSVSGVIPSFSALWLVNSFFWFLRLSGRWTISRWAQQQPGQQISWADRKSQGWTAANRTFTIKARWVHHSAWIKKPRYPLVDVKISVQYINGLLLQLSAPHWADQPPSNSHGEHAVFIPTPALYLMFVLLPRGCKPAEEAAVQDLLKSADVKKRGGWACVSHLTFSHILSSFKTLGVHRDPPLRPVKSW